MVRVYRSTGIWAGQRALDGGLRTAAAGPGRDGNAGQPGHGRGCARKLAPL